MANIALKQPIVDEIKAQLDGAKSLVVVDYRGISVADVTELRRQCREAGIVYKVYKNTMVRRAVEGTEFEGVIKDLEGTNAFALSKDDATAPARVIAAFIKKAKCCQLKSGVVEGTYYDEEGINTIASIPSRDELIAKFMGSIQSPITNFARVIKQIAEKDGEGGAEEAAEAAE
jgi:large subunit ribosomal protein L10